MTFPTNSIGQVVAPFVEGDLSQSDSDETIDVINPSNGRRCLSIPVGCDADVDRAVRSARRAFESGQWSQESPSFRRKALHRLADLLESEAASLDALDAEEMGKPISEPMANANSAAGLVRFYAEAVDKVTGDAPGCDRNSLVIERRVPRGVVAAVVPWNFPLFNAALKTAPALAAGNCVVLKPSELSSRSAIKLAHLAALAGLPPGVLNVVPGAGETVGRALALHHEVDMLTFTGSTQVGKKMLQYSGQSNMKVVMTECGGKSPQIVFDDSVNLDSVCDAVTSLLLTNQGQLCSVGSRLLVQRSIEPAVLEAVSAKIQKYVMGDAMDPKTTFGPLVSANQCDRVMQYIEGAEVEGAQRVAGGRRVLRETGGYFVEPTLFGGVSPDSRLAQDEIFGPVLSVIPFDDEAEAIRIANGTVYGLMAYVWTSDLSRGLRMAKAIRSPVMINAAAPSGEGPGYSISYEPARQSGIGTECGLAGMESYLRRQAIWFNHA
jgi:acyl-CoA reductase-like NAD-dependent aldehyde dehydrogenase